MLKTLKNWFSGRGRWLLVVAGFASAALGVGAFVAARSIASQLPAIVRQRAAEGLGRPVRLGKVSLWPPGAFTIEDLELPPVPGERKSPLRARGAVVRVAWLDFLLHGRLRVNGIDLIAPKVRGALDLRTPAPGQPSFNQRILQLAGLGVGSVGISDADVRLVVALPGGGEQTISARGVDGRLAVTPSRFTYSASAQEWAQSGALGPFQATRLSAEGRGDAQLIRLTDSAFDYQHGQLEAQGTYRTAGEQLVAHVSVHDFPLAAAALQMGVPREVRLAGRVTGELEMLGERRELRSVRGLLTADAGELRAAGMSREFAWNSARARLDWNREGGRLDDVRVVGDGIEITGSGAVTGRPEALAAAGRFNAEGQVRVRGQRAAARLAELLAYRSPLGGGWSADGGTFEFTAQGPVSSLAGVEASGRFAVDGLSLRPDAADAPVRIARLAGEFRRQAGGLRLSALAAESPGIHAGGELRLTNQAGDRPVSFEADGQVRIDDPQALHRLLPRAAMWRWLAGAPGRGEFRLHASGPVQPMSAVRAEGTFDLRDGELELPSAGAKNPAKTARFPLTRARGRFVHDEQSLRLSEMQLESEGVRARASVKVEGLHAADPAVLVEAQVSGSGWERLAGLPPGTTGLLRGGAFAGAVRLASPVSRIAAAPLTGRLELKGARLVLPNGSWELPVETVSARFAREGDSVRLTEIRLEGDGVGAAGSVTLIGLSGPDPRVEGTVSLNLEQWQRFAALPAELRDHLRGGRLAMQVDLAGPAAALNSGPRSVEFRLENAALAWNGPGGAAFSEPLETLAGKFTREKGGAGSVHVKIAGRSVQGEGDVRLPSPAAAGQDAEVQARVRVRGWQRLPGLPSGVAGSITGGDLLADISARGSVSDLAAARGSADLELRNASAAIAGRDAARPVRLKRLALRIERQGDAWKVASADLDTGAFRVRGSGEAQGAGRQLSFRGQVESPDVGAALSGLGFPLSLRGGRLAADFELRGSLPQLADADLSGSLKVASARLQSDPASAPLAVEAFRTQFKSVREGIALEGAELQLPGSRWTGSGLVSDLSGRQPQIAANVAIVTEAWRDALGLDAGWEAIDGGRLVVSGTLEGPLSALALSRGDFQLQGVRVRLGSGSEPVPVTSLTGQFARGGSVTRLTGLRLVSPIATAEGSGELGPAGHRLDIKWQLEPSGPVPPALGQLTAWLGGGRLSGTGLIQGRQGAPADRVEGSFVLRDARLGGPGGTAGFRFDRAWMEGRFRKDGRDLVLSDVAAGSGDLRVTGRARVVPDSGEMRVQLDVPNLGALLDRMPHLEDSVEGGRLQADLTIRSRPDGTPPTGHGKIQVTGGNLVVAGLDEKFRRATIDPVAAEFDWDAGGAQIRSLSLRGSKYNLDASGRVNFAGTIDMKGKAWVSSDFGKSLMPRGVVGFLGRLFGMIPKKLQTGFEITGALQRPVLDLSITDTRLWSRARGSVPGPVQRIATGKAPLWDLSVLEASDPPAGP